MKKILVVGEGSFVGDSFIEYMTTEFSEEYCINNVASTGKEWNKEDFGKYDAVYNVAGLAHVKAKKSMEGLYYQVNRDLPVEMAKKAKREGCKLFIHMSSMIVYGGMSRYGKQKIITRETVPNPENFYGGSKLQADEQLMKLADDNFHVAVMRPPLIYSHNARDNFPRLVNFSKVLPVFPLVKNEQSMIYVYNLAELIRLIIEAWGGGIYYPQNSEYTCTSEMVKKFADEFGNKMKLTKFFNPVLWLLAPMMPIVNKAFGNLCYEKDMSDYFDGKYQRYSLMHSIEITAAKIKEKE